jgi:hypothetical protein
MLALRESPTLILDVMAQNLDAIGADPMRRT